MVRLACVMSFALLLLGCGEDSAPTPPAKPDTPALPKVDEASHVHQQPRCRLLIDGKEVGTISVDKLEARTPLAVFLPEEIQERAKWALVRVTASDRSVWRVNFPTQRFPEKVAWLYRGKGDVPSFEFGPETAPEGTHVIRIEDLTQVEVFSEAGAKAMSGRVDPSQRIIKVVIDGGTPSEMKSGTLVSLPRAPAIEGLRRGARGASRSKSWLLSDVLPFLAGKKPLASARFVASNGKDATLTPSQWEGKSIVLHQNRRGQYLVREFEGGKRVSELRDVTELHLSLAK